MKPKPETPEHPRVEAMSRALASRTQKRYVCAGCWSDLIIQPDKANPQLDHVLCPNCETPGYVSRRYAERQASESAAAAIDARHNLREALPFLNPNAGKQVTELLAELGF
jgi:DNA-directed RNA polymerase subunit RPC12/RpoP